MKPGKWMKREVNTCRRDETGTFYCKTSFGQSC
jgi:hypothetical protein